MLHPRRVSFLKWIYKQRPFNLSGDMAGMPPPMVSGMVSCIIPYTHKDLLTHLLDDLKLQDLPPSQLEIIPIHSTDQRIGYLRNLGLSQARGEFILFLDDDTHLFQPNFIKESIEQLKAANVDSLIPHGQALYCYLKNKNQYLKPFVFATRCCLIRRSALEKINGFRNLYSFEDTELRIRLELSGHTLTLCKEIQFWHPPYDASNWQKPLSLAQSILSLRTVYPFYIWILIYLNQFSLSVEKNRMKHAISLLVCALTRKKRREYAA